MALRESGGDARLEYRFVFSSADNERAFARANRRHRRDSWIRFASNLAAATVFTVIAWLIFNDVKPVNRLALLISMSAAVLSCFRSLKYLPHPFDSDPQKFDFATMEVRVCVDEHGISNETPFIRQLAIWPFVTSIVAAEYGIQFRTKGPSWFIPISAFASPEAMRAEHNKILAFQERYKKQPTYKVASKVIRLDSFSFGATE